MNDNDCAVRIDIGEGGCTLDGQRMPLSAMRLWLELMAKETPSLQAAGGAVQGERGG